MRTLNIALAALLGLTALSALAQTPPPLDGPQEARIGHEPGVGQSLPLSDKAGNIAPGGAMPAVAPTLPSPAVGDSSFPGEYLRSARAALVGGHTGLAQQSLEMAETRALDRVVPPGETTAPSASPVVMRIEDALHALSKGDNAGAIVFIDRALAS